MLTQDCSSLGFDTVNFRQACQEKGIFPNVKPNIRNAAKNELYQSNTHIFDEELYKDRSAIEHSNAWINGLKALLVRFDFSVIFLRKLAKNKSLNDFIMKCFPIPMILLFFCTSLFGQQSINHFLTSSFESENDTIFKIIQIEKCCDSSIVLSSSISRTGKKSLKFSLNKNDSAVANGKRSEIVFPKEISAEVFRKYMFSIYLPDEYLIDSEAEILAQWHEYPDFSLGETWRIPPISLRVVNNHWQIVIYWAVNPINNNNTVSGYKTFDLGLIDKKKWIDWQFNIYFSYKNDGSLKIWKDNKLVLDYDGPNYYNDVSGPYFKLGIYKWPWNNNWQGGHSIVTNREVYVDDVVVQFGN